MDNLTECRVDGSCQVTLNIMRIIASFGTCCAYTFIECGASRSQNAVHSMFKLLLTLSMTVLGFCNVGYVLAFGLPANAILGFGRSWRHNGTVQSDSMEPGSPLHMIFHSFLCAICVLSSSTCFAERLRLCGHAIHCLVMTCFVYPVICHWLWSPSGWLRRYGAIDLSGGMTIYLTSSVAGFIGTWILGPRIGRFKPRAIPLFGHSLPLSSLGYLVCVAGIMLLNTASIIMPSSSERLSTASDFTLTLTGASLTNSILCASSSALVFCLISRIWKCRHRELKRRLHLSLCNSILAGCVAMSSGARFYSSWMAIMVGMWTSLIYAFTSKLLSFVKIDDPADIATAHFAGSWTGSVLLSIMRPNMASTKHHGKGDLRVLIWNVTGCVCIMTMTAILYSFVFLILSFCKYTRFSDEDELRGVDLYHFGEPAYALRIYCGSCGEQLQSREKEQPTLKRPPPDTACSHNNIVTDAEGAIVPLEYFVNRSSLEAPVESVQSNGEQLTEHNI